MNNEGAKTPREVEGEAEKESLRELRERGANFGKRWADGDEHGLARTMWMMWTGMDGRGRNLKFEI